MLYDRTWFKKDTYGLTIGGGKINNPGRYLVLLPPINGETASSAAINAPYFTGNPADPFKAWDISLTYDYMPQAVAHFPLGIRLSPRQRALLDGSRRNYAAGFGRSALHQQRISAVLCLQRRKLVDAGDSQCRGADGAAQRRAAAYGSLICARDESFIDIDILVKF